uniref:BTB/POZ domain-containing protein 6-B-like isoform X2 n=1 Tax=Myxine glutinosa TaxID=7769 RepID=UPI00358FF733
MGRDGIGLAGTLPSRCLSFVLLLPEALKRARLRRAGNGLRGPRPGGRGGAVSGGRPELETRERSLTGSAGKKPRQQQQQQHAMGPHEHWQEAFPTVRERNALMYNNDLMADVHFLVGPPEECVRIPAHKYVLAVGSSVFQSMLFSNPCKNTEEIALPDMQPDAFLVLMKYIYCDEVDLTVATVLPTYQAAKKFDLPHLQHACEDYLIANLNSTNVCDLLVQTIRLDEMGFTQHCWRVVDAAAARALRSAAFCRLDRSTLDALLQRESLAVSESTIFDACLAWAEAECDRRGLVLTPMNKRYVLGPSLKLVRVPAIPLEDFANGAAQSGILTAEEVKNIFLYHTAGIGPPEGFFIHPRVGLHTQHCLRFQSAANRANQWRYKGRCDSVQFAVDQRIFIAGLGLYGSSRGPAEYAVTIELKLQATVVAQTETRLSSDGSDKPFTLWFDEPAQVEPDTFYTASAVLHGSQLSHFGQDGLPEVQCGDVTFLFQGSPESTNGTGVQGGQIPEIIFYS